LRASTVSVLMPVRDAQDTLDQALLSLFRQTYKDFDLVVVDDGSTDDTGRILELWRRREPRLRVLPVRGTGLIDALETGRMTARSPYLARMDADDVCHPRRLELQMKALRGDRRLGGVGCLVRVFPRGSMKKGWHRYERWVNGLISPEDIHSQRFVESPLVHPSVVLSAQAVDQVGGYRDAGWPEDHDLWLRMMESGYFFTKVPKTLLFWRERPGRVSRVHSRYHPESFRAMKLAHLLGGPLKEHREVVIWGAGQNGRRWAKLLVKAGVSVQAFLDIDEAKIGRNPYGIPVWPPSRVTDAAFILGAVAVEGARHLIRQKLCMAGKTEEVDFLFVQ
jgi:glycosyltransferase involved in cell wall biosynthesis